MAPCALLVDGGEGSPCKNPEQQAHLQRTIGKPCPLVRPFAESTHAVNYVGEIQSAELEAEREFIWSVYTRDMGVGEVLDFLARVRAFRDALRKEQEKRSEARRNARTRR